jgi:ABC-2 type transport system permease protein
MTADTTGTHGPTEKTGSTGSTGSTVPSGLPRASGASGPSTATRPSGAAPGYRARATLPLRVEAVRQLRRRRTLVTFAVVVFLPVIVWAVFAIGDQPGGRENFRSLIDVATSSGLNFAVGVVFVSSGFLLMLPVALFFGDTVASEAGWSSLRYLLAAPVPRNRLLMSKALVAFGFSAAAVLVLPAMALGVGTVAYGWGDVQLPTGGSLSASTAARAFVAIALYVFVSQLAVAGLAFWLSTVTDAPLGAVGGAVGVAILSNILDAITALGSVRDILPTHWLYAWSDLLQPAAEWAGMVKGTSVSLSYAVVFLALAFHGFRNKDIVS